MLFSEFHMALLESHDGTPVCPKAWVEKHCSVCFSDNNGFFLESVAVDGQGASRLQPPPGHREVPEEHPVPLSCDPGGGSPVGE